MKQSKLLSVLFVFILSLNFCQAQEKIKLENSVLWKIDRIDLKMPSYLFGSLHIMCDGDFNIPAKVIETFKSVDALVLEVNLSDPNELNKFQESMGNSKKISEEVSKEKYHKLDSLVTEVMGVPLEAYDEYGLSILHSILITKMLPCSKYKSFEKELSGMASENKKALLSLEKASQQIEILKNAYPSAFAYKQIMLFESYKKDFNEAIAQYKMEDITKTVALISKEKYMDANATNLMQINRNKKWVEKMPQMMKERSNLFAVGAAHLVDEYGLINLLREAGYTVTPVIN
ncbi:TraB/GumN family protein [Bizionia paragorgiae]|uniref:TraB/GumN family protein n=1 Tax=Bizionia paragorgiae TaxID=283786 RepID=UPI003A93CE61